MGIISRQSLWALSVGMAAAIGGGFMPHAARANDAGTSTKIVEPFDARAAEAGLEPHQAGVRRRGNRGRVIVRPRRGTVVIRRAPRFYAPRYYSAPRLYNRCAVVYNQCYAAYGRGSSAYYYCMRQSGC
jgi:hypothetical protein